MKQELSDIELETYSRQIALEDIDYDGQLKLRNAKACIIGLGGLGAPIALKLVAMGIGYLRIVDRDIVSRSDLHRQYLYDVDSVGLPKVEVALRKLNRLNPDVKLEDCSVCGDKPAGSPEPLVDKYFEETCARDGRRNFIISPKRRIEINFEQLRMILSERGFRIKSSGIFGITFEQSDDVIISILKGGIMVAQASPKLKSDLKDEVFEIYNSIVVDGLGLPYAILPEG